VDPASLVRHANNRNVWRNLTHRFPHPYTDVHAEAWFAMLEGMHEASHRAIAIDGEAAGAIGCMLGEAHWGRGVMTAAVKAVVPYAMQRFRLVRLESPVFEWNPASMPVLEKCGFTREAVLRSSVAKDGQITDSVLYAFVDPTRR
jgi:[ribosomal protein S5]-alanine N-acetyltransferase